VVYEKTYGSLTTHSRFARVWLTVEVKMRARFLTKELKNTLMEALAKGYEVRVKQGSDELIVMTMQDIQQGLTLSGYTVAAGCPWDECIIELCIEEKVTIKDNSAIYCSITEVITIEKRTLRLTKLS